MKITHIETAYTWSIITYATYDEFLPLLNSAKHWAYAYHDKDTKITDEGEVVPKEPHYHIIATFENKFSNKQIIENILSTQNTFFEKPNNQDETKNKRALYRYLIHDGWPDKYQYDKSERIVDDEEYWKKQCEKELLEMIKQEQTSQFIDDLISPDISKIDMARKYGRDYIRNFSKYQEFRNIVIEEIKEKNEKQKDKK